MNVNRFRTASAAKWPSYLYPITLSAVERKGRMYCACTREQAEATTRPTLCTWEVRFAFVIVTLLTLAGKALRPP